MQFHELQNLAGNLFEGNKIMGIKAEETAVIGDQLFTDIYGGNKLNMFTILVKPIATKEFIFVRMKRLAEKFVLARHAKSNQKDLKINKKLLKE